jgi:hypothetical protein
MDRQTDRQTDTFTYIYVGGDLNPYTIHCAINNGFTYRMSLSLINAFPGCHRGY